MRTSKFIYKLMGGILLLTVLAGCAAPTPTATLVPTQEPTVNIEPTFDVIRTQAVGTAFAELTLKAPTATATIAPTSTPQPTATAAATRTLAPLWTWTPTLSSVGCVITDFAPALNSTFAPNASFDGRWEIKNKGDGSWKTNETDIRYVSGTKFHSGPDVIDLRGDVGEEETTEVILDMQAPANAGTYVTNWAIYRGNDVLCGLSLTIIVQ